MTPTHSEEQLYKSIDFTEKDLSHSSFMNCTFENCNFTGSIWNNGIFSNCFFNSCNLSLVKLENCRLQHVLFTDCKIVGAEFYKCEKKFFSINSKNCLILYCNYSDLNMKRASFQKSKIKESFFTATCLVEADFTHADLQGTIFHQSDLSKADFRNAINYVIDPQTNKVKEAKFSFPEVTGLLNGFEIEIT